MINPYRTNYNEHATDTDRRAIERKVKNITHRLIQLVGREQAQVIAAEFVQDHKDILNTNEFVNLYEVKYQETVLQQDHPKPEPKDKPEITRVDVKVFPNNNGKITVKKYANGWTCHSRPVKFYETDKMSIAEMEQWFIDNGWTVYKWEACGFLGIPQGLRAFLPDENGHINSVRNRYEMKKYRSELQKRVDAHMRTPESYKQPLPEIAGRIHVIDLAKEL